MFYNLVVQRMNVTEKLHDHIDFENLIYHYKGPNANVNFNGFNDVTTLFDQIKSSRIKFDNTERHQMECKWKLINIRIESTKSDKQDIEIKNLMILYKAQEDVIKLYKDY